MDQTDEIILKVRPKKIPMLEIWTNKGNRYLSDLSYFYAVYCFPKSNDEWKDVRVDTSGYSLSWGCGFEVHVDQVVSEEIAERRIVEGGK